MKQNKENPDHRFVDIGKQTTCVRLEPKLVSPMVVGARQSFHFFRHNTWFLENIRALPNFLDGILHYLISIIVLQKNQSIKSNFTLRRNSQFTLIIIKTVLQA